MRLPWLQIDADGQTRARMLARLLGIPEPQGLGIALALWTWALEMAEDGDFSGRVKGDEVLLAAAVSWPIERAKELLEQLQRVGFVATAPVLRVRGLDRYRRTWEKNQRRRVKRPESGSAVPGTGDNPATTRAEPARKTETDITTTDLSLTLVEPPSTDHAHDVFEHWKRATNKPRAVLDNKRRDLIERRLAEGHLPEDLKAAIDGYARSAWHRGENDRKRPFLGLDLMLRDAAHIEAGLDLLMQDNAITPQSESRSFA